MEMQCRSSLNPPQRSGLYFRGMWFRTCQALVLVIQIGKSNVGCQSNATFFAQYQQQFWVNQLMFLQGGDTALNHESHQKNFLCTPLLATKTSQHANCNRFSFFNLKCGSLDQKKKRTEKVGCNLRGCRTHGRQKSAFCPSEYEYGHKLQVHRCVSKNGTVDKQKLYAAKKQSAYNGCGKGK